MQMCSSSSQVPFEMPGIDHLLIVGNCFFFRKGSLALQFEPKRAVLTADLPSPFHRR
jgi:hypothetical protein